VVDKTFVTLEFSKKEKEIGTPQYVISLQGLPVVEIGSLG